MPASKRVSLRDREERESNVRRALGAFITQPQETMDVTQETNVADKTLGTIDTFVTQDTNKMKDTDVTDTSNGTTVIKQSKVTNGSNETSVPKDTKDITYTKGTPVSDVLDDTHVIGVTQVNGVTSVTRNTKNTNNTKGTKAKKDTSVKRAETAYDLYGVQVRDLELPASFMLKGRRFDPPVGARKRQNYALSSETIKRIALASAHAGVGKAELVDAVLCAALRDILGDEG